MNCAVKSLSHYLFSEWNILRTNNRNWAITAYNNRHTEEALSAVYPESHLNFQGNVVNKLATKFYKHHGVNTIDPGLEVQSDYKNKQVMTAHHCLKFTFGMCSKEPKSTSGSRIQRTFLPGQQQQTIPAGF